MTIEAKIIADSISPDGIRLTTFQLRYPRFIHAELMTHRVFSRNASSSRAIPVAKMIAELKRDPAMPIYWGSNKPGMQAGDEITPLQRDTCKNIWLNARDVAIQQAELLMKQGLHKQIANRILEPWAHINVVVTATDYENFFALRCHKDAQPELRALAVLMRAAMQPSVPEQLEPGEWHLPYIDKKEQWDGEIDLMKAVSVARCARVSYLTHDGRETDPEEDLALYHKLVVAQPLHASPAEHQATPDDRSIEEQTSTPLGGNFRGWIQLRKTLPGEFVAG